jgi:hypothetical protein
MKTTIIALLFNIYITSVVYCQKKSNLAYVMKIYPTADSIPINILRFYIEFSEPIREKNALMNVHLSEDGGKDLSHVFFDNNYELWNENRTKLTLIFDPGRVKTGLIANKQMGRALKSGAHYQISVDSLFTTMSGSHLTRNFVKKFVAIEEDTLAPALAKWKIKVPCSDSRLPLVVNFQEPIDHISALGYLIITDNKGEKMQGNLLLKKNENEWEFTPTRKWKRGEYKLFVNDRLEDIAANNLNGNFDHKQGSLKNSVEGKEEVTIINIK